MTKKIFKLGFVLAAFCHLGPGQRLAPSAPFVLNVDYARFHHDMQAGYVELYYGFYPRLTTFEARDGKYQGGIKLKILLVNKISGEAPVSNSYYLPLAVADTGESSFRHTYVSQAGYFIPFGDYTLSVTATDSLNQGRGDSIRLSVQVTKPETLVTMSDVELCSEVKSSEDKGNAFYKNSLEVVPNPMLVFGVTTVPVVFHYTEIYNLQPESTYVVKTKIIDNKDKVMRESSKTMKYGIKNAVEAGVTNVSSFPSGRYKFNIGVWDGAGVQVASSSRIMFVYNPHIQSGEQTAQSLKASQLAGMSAEELADEFRKARYLATDQEIKLFSQVSSAEGRRDLLAKLWTEAEEGRTGHAPIDRLEYLNRVAVANKRYHTMSRDGYQSDRGRVYVLYGEPDEIERHPSDQESKPYEIWNYYNLENGVLFVFVDRTGFGEYILVHSTKRGELRDDSWKRFLQ